MLKNLSFKGLENFNSLLDAIQEKKTASVFGMGFSEKILSSLSFARPVLYVTADPHTAKKAFDEFKAILNEGVSYFPAGSDVSIYRKAQSNEANKERIKTAFDLVLNQAKVVVTSVDALFSYLPNKNAFKSSIISFAVNQTIELGMVKTAFVKMGYVSNSLVTEKGQFSVRGDIVDIFPINADYPYRIELFDNLIESIKLFDPETQRSSEPKRELIMCPYTNLLLSTKEIDEVKKKLIKLKSASLESREASTRLETIVDEIISRIENGDLSFSMDFLFPLVTESLGTLFDYLSPDFLVVFDECKMVYDALTKFSEEKLIQKKELKLSGESLPVNDIGYLSKQKVIDGFNPFTKLAHQKLTNANKLFEPKFVTTFRSAPGIKYSSNINEFFTDLENWIMDGYRVFLCAGDILQAETLLKKLENNDIYLNINPNAKLTDKNSAIVPAFLSNGFVLPTEKIVVVGTYDLFPKKSNNQSLLLKKKAVFSVPEVGSYVVHRFHGIGMCEGVTKLTGSFGTKDFIVVAYHGGDKLYVPIDQMDQLDKYSAGGAPKKLSKIGGVEFASVKERVKKQIKEMAFSLLKLYAERDAKTGYCYQPDDELQHEFESKFPYTETEDQLTAINDVKQDMETGKVMDRLICGDVGFGKTEVALRSAFKAVVNGKQVAFIAPTTLLARQHYNTCLSRMAEFGVRVEVLDRFVPTKKAKEVIRAVGEHKVDVLCGTHKVLGKDVLFDDLGLVILDEEQKFGVEHKEKIKLDQKDIDVLTLSATPIPRTLHMSLSGIRDISVISTPPTNRTPTQTYVTEYSDALVKSVIERELRRDGQVFIVYNRVETIYNFTAHIQALVPNAKIVVGHGQLSGAELEDVIYKFYNHMADILICTTIIENGIDLPNANSLIVVDSDRLGLSSLYQIRGRVGRGSRAGYAYFTYKPEKVLTEESAKRLEALAEFTEFGSGFKVAMRDLEIRGSGNVFGAEQHGHIEKVGYELYSKMLKDALLELKGKSVTQDKDCQVKVNLDAFIPENYIQDGEDRMTIYKNISLIENDNDRKGMVQELTDRYGKLPHSLVNLINIALLKSMAIKIGVGEIYMSEKAMKLTFFKDEDLTKREDIAYAISKFFGNAVLNFGSMATISFKNILPKAEDNFKILEDFISLVLKSKKSN